MPSERERFDPLAGIVWTGRVSVRVAERLRDGLVATEGFLRALTLPYLAPSLGGVETLVTLPAQTSHAGMSVAQRERSGVTDDLVRVSCGIEDAEDLIADFRQALEAA